MALILFGTSGCHLCEEAESIMGTSFQKIELDRIDIAEEEQWQEKYAIKIPVLYHQETGKELFWPFSESDVEEYIRALNLG